MPKGFIVPLFTTSHGEWCLDRHKSSFIAFVFPGPSTGLIINLLDRLPTISVSQALQKLNTPGAKWVSTGLPLLDKNLKGSSLNFATQEPNIGGFVKGQITEIYGPPASGKTALA
jgi:hypothetical protein